MPLRALKKNLGFIHCPRANMCSKYSHQIPRMCPHSSYMGFEAPGTGSKEYSKFKPETISIRQHGPTRSFPYNVFLEKKSRFCRMFSATPSHHHAFLCRSIQCHKELQELHVTEVSKLSCWAEIYRRCSLLCPTKKLGFNSTRVDVTQNE